MRRGTARAPCRVASLLEDRKSTRLNSSHSQISYAVFCLKKKKRNNSTTGQARRMHSSYTKTPTCTHANETDESRRDEAYPNSERPRYLVRSHHLCAHKHP